MTKLITTILLILAVTLGCKSGKNSSGQNKSKEGSDEFPSWLEHTIEKNNFEQISSYLFKGDTVFLMIPPCCDRFSELYDEQGKLICHPSGGITGRGDGTCPEFRDDATQLKTIVENYSRVDE